MTIIRILSGFFILYLIFSVFQISKVSGGGFFMVLILPALFVALPIFLASSNYLRADKTILRQDGDVEDVEKVKKRTRRSLIYGRVATYLSLVPIIIFVLYAFPI